MSFLPETVIITRTQAVQLMALHQMIREGDIAIRGDDDGPDAACAAIKEVAEECALQLGGMP